VKQKKQKDYGDCVEINHSLLPGLIESKFKNQKEFAKHIGVPYSTLSSWILGKRRPRTRDISEMCEALEIESEILMEEAANLFYQGQLVSLMRWALAQTRGEGELPTYNEAEVITKRIEVMEQQRANQKAEEQETGTREEDVPF